MDIEFDNFDAPQFFDFANDVVPDDIDKFFDVGYEKPAANARRSRRSSSVPPAMLQNEVPAPEEKIAEDQEDKENSGPTPARVRSSSVPPQSKNASRVLADISCTASSAPMTPSTAKKAKVSYLDNGRSVVVHNYDGIELITPNKTHQMETRLDLTINSPGLSLRSRSVTKPVSRVSRVEAIPETEKEIEKAEAEAMDVDVPDGAPAEKAEPEQVAQPDQPAAPKGRSVVLLPSLLPQKPLQVAKPAPTAQQPEQKLKRIQHSKPMIAQLRPVKAAPLGGPSTSKPAATSTSYQPTAELVRKFHKATPDRFHSVPANQKLQHKKLPSPIGNRPNTIPKSPFLVSKSRVRNEHIPSQADKEQAEIEEIKKHQIKAKPVPRQVLVPPVQKNIAVAKTQPTKPEPFKLTQVKRKEATPEPVFQFKANPVPRRLLQSPQGIPAKQDIPLTEPHTPALALNAKYPKRPKLDGVDLKKIGHSGVPVVKQMTPGKLTQVQPFSFEERNKEIQQKRMELIQKQIEDEKVAREFRAGKLPNFSRAPLLPEKKAVPTTVPHTPKLSTFTLGARNQQKFYERLAEEEQRMQEAATFKAKPATVTQAEPFKPVLPHRVITDTTNVPELHLNTEKRAAERAKFEEMLRIQEKAQEESRLMLEKLKEEEAREEEMRLRKEAEFVANPVRRGTPMKIKPSDRPLTEPVSPRFRVDERLANHKLN